MENKVIVGFSGGVDSSVCAFLLQKAGYEVIGVQLLINNNQHENMEFAQRAAQHLGIKLIFDNCEDEFGKSVLDSFINNYNKGITLSPCPLCNDVFKFARLSEIAEREGADKIATGHYASVKVMDDNLHYIRRWNSTFKDQSYMLYRLPPDVLARVIFPLSRFENKSEVRHLAREIGLNTAERRDSQGLCFAPKGIMQLLLDTNVKLRPGLISDKNGSILGEHKGYQLYTVGQRRGLGLKMNAPLFVTKIIPDENKIIVGDYDDLYTDKIKVTQLVLHGKFKQCEARKNLTARLRSSAGFVPVKTIENDCVILEKPTPWSAPGQHLVLYDGSGDEKSIVAGGGIITL